MQAEEGGRPEVDPGSGSAQPEHSDGQTSKSVSGRHRRGTNIDDLPLVSQRWDG